jgi:hypothetical protein
MDSRSEAVSSEVGAMLREGFEMPMPTLRTRYLRRVRPA